MRKLLLILAATFASVPAFANEFNCQSTGNEINARLIFGGMGGLDADEIFVDGQQVSLTDRDSFKNSYEYTEGLLEIGFGDQENGLELDFLAKASEGNTLVGKVYVKSAEGAKVLDLTCTEN